MQPGLLRCSTRQAAPLLHVAGHSSPRATETSLYIASEK